LRHPAPELGQHNREVLAHAGIGDARYEMLLAAGIIRESTHAPEER
jgi:hypothetical protein